MKKTLIALAVAVSAAVSGSAMAWTANGTGGSVDMGGTLNPVDKVTPWEVKTGAAVTGLDADIRKGDTKVDIPVTNAIPVLGIRSVEAKAFDGAPGITPQISYNNAVDVDGFTGGVTTVTLELKDASNMKIGSLTAPFSAAGVMSWQGVGISSKNIDVYASTPGKSFFGGVGKNSAGANSGRAEAMISSFDQEFLANFVKLGSVWRVEEATFGVITSKYSGAYGSGIEAGKNITITLDSPAQGDNAIVWKASLPVTVSYE
ncbi:K88 fimbrial protein AB [Escherichia coli]|uniref:F4 family fimbrial subunit n=1 Tax=Escherichia coli TaxID=562 RepID=UPI0010CB4D54|nr:fimbrial protein [Escherichia coli]GDA02249.1 K88 fimbrial protein AB [Escherichia coli]